AESGSGDGLGCPGRRSPAAPGGAGRGLYPLPPRNVHAVQSGLGSSSLTDEKRPPSYANSERARIKLIRRPERFIIRGEGNSREGAWGPIPPVVRVRAGL